MKKILVSGKNILVKIYILAKKIKGSKIFGVKQNFGSKEKNILGQKAFFGQKKNFDPKKFLG